jgi:acyl CoA:acetate/3-ketoacid CoA transferase beta subunit
MAYLGREPQYGSFEKQSITADGSTTTFTLDYTVGSSSSIFVSVAGVAQEPEVAYNIGSGGTQIIFTAAPASSDTVFVIFLGIAMEVATLGTGAITGQTELAEVAANDDLLLIYDTSAGALKKIQKSNIATTLTYTTRTGTGDGSTTGFTVTSGVTVDDVLVTENGVLQAPTTDYTISGTTLTFGTAPASGVAIVIRELP